MSLNSADTIDVHAHAVLEATMGAAGPHGPELSHDELPVFRVGQYELHGVRYRDSVFMEPDLRIAAMDKAGIDYQILSPNPLTYFHFIEETDALQFCRIHNDALADMTALYPDRLGAFAAVPMQNIDYAIAETERAVTELGFLGPYIGTDFGMSLNDPALDRLYERLTALNVPLFIHPAPANIDGPSGDKNLQQFDLDIIVGFAASETIAVCTLIYGGVLERFPQLDVCLSHGGGFSGYAFGRMALAAKKRPWATGSLKQDGAFEELLHRLWFDVHVHSDEALEFLKKQVNVDHLVFGTNFAGWDQQQHNVRTEAGLYTDNARRLLRALS